MSGSHPLVLLLDHVLVHEVLLLQQHLLVLLRRGLLSRIIPRRHAQLRSCHAPSTPWTRLQTTQTCSCLPVSVSKTPSSCFGQVTQHPACSYDLLEGQASA